MLSGRRADLYSQLSCDDLCFLLCVLTLPASGASERYRGFIACMYESAGVDVRVGSVAAGAALYFRGHCLYRLGFSCWLACAVCVCAGARVVCLSVICGC